MRPTWSDRLRKAAGRPARAGSGSKAIFSNLGLLFTVGVSVSLAKDNNGAAGLAGVVCFLITVEASKVLLSVPPEIIAGLSGHAATVASKTFQDQALLRLGVPIGFVAGLIVTGLHHILNNVGLFRAAISVLKLKTPGREDEPTVSAETRLGAAIGKRAEGFVAALGGAASLHAIVACTTRQHIGSRDLVDEAALKRLGERGVISPGPNQFQLVLGPIADAVADEINAALPPTLSEDLIQALGGPANVQQVERKAGRLCIQIGEADVKADALADLLPRGFVRSGPHRVQLLGVRRARLVSSSVARNHAVKGQQHDRAYFTAR